MVELTEYAKEVLRRNPDKVRELMRQQGRTDEEVATPEDEQGGSLVDLFENIRRVETNGDRN